MKVSLIKPPITKCILTHVWKETIFLEHMSKRTLLGTLKILPLYHCLVSIPCPRRLIGPGHIKEGFPQHKALRHWIGSQSSLPSTITTSSHTYCTHWKYVVVSCPMGRIPRSREAPFARATLERTNREPSEGQRATTTLPFSFQREKRGPRSETIDIPDGFIHGMDPRLDFWNEL